MSYCAECGVELAAGLEACPLCGWRRSGAAPESSRAEAGGSSEHGSIAQRAALAPGGSGAGGEGAPSLLTAAEKGTIAWEIASVSFAIASVVLLAIDATTGGGLLWSFYPLASLAFVWILLTAFLRLGRFKFPVAAIAPPLFLVALDAIEGGMGWSLSVGLPVCAVAELSAAAVAFLAWKSRRRGLNVGAFAFIGMTATLMVVEASLQLAAGHPLALRWSAIIAATALPISAFLLYLHHRVVGNADLRRFFRL